MGLIKDKFGGVSSCEFRKSRSLYIQPKCFTNPEAESPILNLVTHLVRVSIGLYFWYLLVFSLL